MSDRESRDSVRQDECDKREQEAEIVLVYSQSLLLAVTDSEKYQWQLLPKLRPCSYASGSLSPGGNHLMVGKPWTSYLLPRASSSVASTLAITTFDSPAKTLPNSSYVGVSCLQCPHHGA